MSSHSNLRIRTNHNGPRRLASELLPLGCLSILRQEEKSPLDQERSQSREDTCCGRQRDNACELVCNAKHFEATKLDNQADHRTFTCVTQTLFNLIVWCFGVVWNRWDALKFKTIGRRIMYNYENCENRDNGKNCAN